MWEVFYFMTDDKNFLSYNDQITLLKSKGLSVPNVERAIKYLEQFSYYSLISGYKDIFKQEPNGRYRSDASFEHIANLYILDDYMRIIFLQNIIIIEKHIKSLYSYSFCELYGDKQNDYLNVTNYKYDIYQDKINDLVSIIRKNIRHSDKYPYVHHHIVKYGEVPLWVIIHTMTFGNISKMFSLSQERLQSQVSRNFKGVYNTQLSSMLNVISKFRNVCAHGERLYNFKTKSSIQDLPIHSKIKGLYSISKNDLFSVCISFKYLLSDEDFYRFIDELNDIMTQCFNILGKYYQKEILSKMGFPNNWKEILLNN